MILFDKNELGKIAKEKGFVRDTYEKVLRLAEVLRFLNEEPFLKEHLVLKGGTAINLTIVDMPRMSVDIDMDALFNIYAQFCLTFMWYKCLRICAIAFNV